MLFLFILLFYTIYFEKIKNVVAARSQGSKRSAGTPKIGTSWVTAPRFPESSHPLEALLCF